MDKGHGRSINVRMIMPSSFVTRQMNNRLSTFVPAGLIIADENVDFPYFGGPWTDHCVTVEQPVTTLSIRTMPLFMRLS